MARGRNSITVLALLLAAFAPARSSILSSAGSAGGAPAEAAAAAPAALAQDAPGGGFRVIVNPTNPVREVSRAFLRDVFLKKTTRWGPGSTIRPVDLPRHFPVRRRFVEEVLHKTPGQLRSYWSQLIFSGKAVPPPELDSEAAVIAYVMRHAGAVGYLPAGADPRGAATVTLK